MDMSSATGTRLVVPIVAFVLAGVAGFVARAAGGGDQPVRPAEANEATYELSNLRVQYPYVAPDGTVDRSQAGITYDLTWRSPTYPGTADCELRALDSTGNVLGFATFEFRNLVPTSLDQAPLPVPVAGAPTAAEGVCAAARLDSGDYRLSNPQIVTTDYGATDLVADIAFGGRGRPGVGDCLATLSLAGGGTREWTFTLQAPEGRMTVASLGEGFEGASVESVSCGPYTGT
jgi:hypothetical protein